MTLDLAIDRRHRCPKDGWDMSSDTLWLDEQSTYFNVWHCLVCGRLWVEVMNHEGEHLGLTAIVLDYGLDSYDG
jgi:hypothetical protein